MIQEPFLYTSIAYTVSIDAEPTCKQTSWHFLPLEIQSVIDVWHGRPTPSDLIVVWESLHKTNEAIDHTTRARRQELQPIMCGGMQVSWQVTLP